MLQLAFPPTQAEKDVLLGVLPFYQIMGMSSGCFFFFGKERLRRPISGAVLLLPFAILIGSPVVIMPQPDPEAFFRHIERYKVTISIVVPTICREIVHHPGMG